MQLEHSFTVPVGVDQAWTVLQDIERIAPCIPGATIEEVSGDTFTGKVRVKVGPITVTYRGEARFSERDESAHVAVIDARGKEARGPGTANATVRAELHEQGSQETEVVMRTDLAVTGRPAQFGRSVMADVGSKLVGKFAECLADELQSGESTPVPDEGETAPPPQTPDEPSTPVPDEAAPAPSDEEDKPAAAATASGLGFGALAHEPAQAGTATGGQAAGVPRRGEEGTSAAPQPARTPRPEAEPIDVFEVAGGAVAKRAAPAFGAALLLALLVWLIRRRR